MVNKRLLGEKGFTIGELMVATIIVLLVSATVVVGVGFSARQYNQSKKRSESEMLAATLAEIVKTELANTRTVTLGSKEGNAYVVDKFFSLNYAIKYGDGQTRFYSVEYIIDSNNERKPALTDSGYGELMLGEKVDETGSQGGSTGKYKMVGHMLLASSAYTEYGLGAKVEKIKYYPDDQIFHVIMHVSDGDDINITREFDVIPLNEINDGLDNSQQESQTGD